MHMISTHNLRKSFTNGSVTTHVLKGITLDIEKGSFVAIMGRSGAGKSTLMYQLSLLDHPTSGDIVFDGIQMSGLSTAVRARMRLEKLGYVFQDYALLPELTAEENVMIPMLMRGEWKGSAQIKAHAALDAVGLANRVRNLPSQMSGGEQQRVSIARAIAHSPAILFADEPTANLDSETSQQVMGIFKLLHQKGQTIIMVTHEEEFGKMAERIIRIHDGQIQSPHHGTH
jgi:putative ABC transport system ATP-binding protein